MSADREKYLERQRRYNNSEKGTQRRWRYEDSERGQEMRWTYHNWIGWLRRRYQALDLAVGRLEKEGEELCAEWTDDPMLETFAAETRERMEEERGKVPQRQRRREESLARATYYLHRERMRRGLIPTADLGPEPKSALRGRLVRPDSTRQLAVETPQSDGGAGRSGKEKALFPGPFLVGAAGIEPATPRV